PIRNPYGAGPTYHRGSLTRRSPLLLPCWSRPAEPRRAPHRAARLAAPTVSAGGGARAVGEGYLCLAERAAPGVRLAGFWGGGAWRPFFGRREGRLRHAGRNLAVAVFNPVVLALLFGSATAGVAAWTQENQLGLLNLLSEGPVRFLLALVLLD